MISIIIWIITGILAGLVASKLTNRGSGGLLISLLLGIVGAAVGGWLLGMVGLSGLIANEWLNSFVTAVIGAAVILWIWGLIKK